MSSRKGSPPYLINWHVTRQAAETSHLAKRAKGGERRQKQWAGYFLGRIVEHCILCRPQAASTALVIIDEGFPLPLPIPSVGDIWTKISAEALGNA
jgi:hypothetical protein